MDKVSDIRIWLERAAKRAGGAIKLGDVIGVPKNTVYGWISGPSEPKASQVAAIIRATGIEAPWPALGASSGFSEEQSGYLPPPAATVSLPRFTVQASAGGGALVQSEEIVDRFVVSRDWLARYVPRGARAGVIEARGDSMEPTIRDGDILLVNFDIDRTAIDGGGVFVITVDGALLVKRLQATADGAILVLSDNDYYQSERVTREFADERMTVHAQVVWSGGPVRRRK